MIHARCDADQTDNVISTTERVDGLDRRDQSASDCVQCVRTTLTEHTDKTDNQCAVGICSDYNSTPWCVISCPVRGTRVVNFHTKPMTNAESIARRLEPEFAALVVVSLVGNVAPSCTELVQQFHFVCECVCVSSSRTVCPVPEP